MKDKRKTLKLVLVILVCITIVSMYFIDKQYYNKNTISKNNTIVTDNKTELAEAFKNEIQDEQENKKVDVEASTSVDNLNIKHNDKGIPVLMYHSIAYEKGNTARVPKEQFKEQMKYLKDNDYVTLTLDEAYDFYIKDKPVPKKSIVLSFDDGYVDNYVEVLPILKEFGFRATIFIITDMVGKNSNYMNVEQLKEMQANKIDIQSHTANHERLKELSYDKQLETLKKSKEFLEKSLDKEIKYLAYPYGEYTKETLKAVKEAGYTMAFATAGRWSDKADGILNLDRVFISGEANLDVFIERITNPNYKF